MGGGGGGGHEYVVPPRVLICTDFRAKILNRGREMSKIDPLQCKILKVLSK